MDEHSLKERTLKSALWASLGGNGAQVLSLILFVLISRVVGPSAFGAVAIGLLLIETLRSFTVESVGLNLVANGNLKPSEFNAGFMLALAFSAAAAILLTISAPFLARLFNLPNLVAVLSWLSPLLVLHAVARLYEAELTLRMRFRALAVRSVGATAIGGAVGLAAAYLGQGVNALILQQWMSLVCALVLMALQSKWRPGLPTDAEQVKRLARQSAVLAPAGLLVNLKQTIDGLLVASFSGAAAVGAYNFAKRTRLALQLGLSAAIGRVSLPAFAAVKDSPARLSSAVEQAVQLSAVIAFPIFVGIAAVAPELVSILLGVDWAAAAAPMTLLMVGGALTVTTRLFENALIICDRRRLLLASNVGALALLVPLLLFSAPFGLGAVAGATTFVAALQNVAAWVMAARIINLRLQTFLAQVWVPLGICLLMLFLIRWLRTVSAEQPASLRLALFICAGAAFYVAASWFLNRNSMLAALKAARIVMPGLMLRT